MKKINFYDAYNKISTKLLETKNLKGLEDLKRFIKQDKDLSKQFMLSTFVKKLTEDVSSEDKKLIKEYCAKINLENKKVIQLLEYFNINPSDVEITSLGKALDNVIRFENGSVVDLKLINESLDLITQPTLKNEQNNDLTRLESLYTSIKESKLKTQFNPVAKRVKLLSEKINDKVSKEFITESIQTLLVGNKSDWETKCINLLEVYRETKLLLEGQYGGEGKLKFTKDVGLFKNIKLIADDDKNNPEYLILWVTAEINTFATSPGEVQEECRQIKKDYINTLRKSIFRSLKETGIYDQDTIHTDTADNIAELAHRKKPLKLSTQIFLNIKKKQDEGKPVSMDKYFPQLIKILAKVSKEIYSQIPQFDPAMHKKNVTVN